MFYVFFYNKNESIEMNLSVFIKDNDKELTKVFSDKKEFVFDKNKKMYKLCVGETFPKTSESFCKISNDKKELLITHIINNSFNKTPFFLCIFLDEKLNNCSTGTDFTSKGE